MAWIYNQIGNKQENQGTNNFFLNKISMNRVIGLEADVTHPFTPFPIGKHYLIHTYTRFKNLPYMDQRK